MRVTLTLKTLATLGLVLLCAVTFAQTPAKDTTSRLLALEGKVEVARAGQAAWTTGVTNQLLQNGDRLRTGARSRATLRLSDASVMIVKELTTLEIRPPQAPGAHSGFEMKSGGSYFFNRERPGTVEFRTPLASGAIRGTEFHLSVAENGRTEVALFDGAVELTNALGGTSLASGEQGVVEPGQAPRKTAMLEASSIIQWVLYYPAVIDIDNLGPNDVALSDDEKSALADSLAAYRAGDLLTAQSSYPENRQPVSDAEKIYRAATLLAVGQVAQATQMIQTVHTPSAMALLTLVNVVKGNPVSQGTPTASTGEDMAESYVLQAQSKLKEALERAKSAANRSTNFGFAWARVAELELSFGRSGAAQDALDQALRLAPRNAYAHTVSGFAQAGRGRFTAARNSFRTALDLDPALAHAWLGHGLMLIRSGQGAEGRQALQVAAAREPQRSLLRSYLGKAWSHTSDYERARKELGLAKKFDPNDPTPWLYSALLNEQHNRVNEAVEDLEKSQELNDNRSVFRSRLLLDQDKAVRSANLARIYQDAGLADWSVREAGRAVSYDYGNFSAHQFLANSYEALRDPRAYNLRYEAPAVSEYFIANLLSPVGATPLSQTVSQQEYSRLFDRDYFGIATSAEYLQDNSWNIQSSLYGRQGAVDYAVEGFYRKEEGQRPNNDLEREGIAARFRAALTAKDTIYFEANRTDLEAGDVAQYYDQDDASKTLRVDEEQVPNIIAGYHREWAPGIHTLFMGTRYEDDFRITDPNYFIPFLKQTSNVITRVIPTTEAVKTRSELEYYTGELQQIFTTRRHTLIVGIRYQDGNADNYNSVSNAAAPNGWIDTQFKNETDFSRVSIYGYEQWRPWEPVQFTAGIAYDRLHYPDNIDTAPYASTHSTEDQVSPKAGVTWAIRPDTHLRGAFTRSLGGVFFDNSFRLEPTQVGGFNQAYRSIAPESAFGIAPAAEMQTLSVGIDHQFPTRTYLNLDAEWLHSDSSRTIGTISNTSILAIGNTVGRTQQDLEYDERSLTLSVNQLIGRHWAFGLRYRVSEAEASSRFPDVSNALATEAGYNHDDKALLQQLTLTAYYNLPCGFFAQADAVYEWQKLRGDLSPLDGDEVLQFNLYAGYRLWHRHAEVRVGVLNVTDQDYQFHPINLYSELPRERTFYASFRFYF